MRNALTERDLEALVRALASSGTASMIVKGWAVARFYPDPDLRPYGDIDVVVAPEDYQRARATVARLAPLLHAAVDLHGGLRGLLDHELDDVLARSTEESLGGVRVRSPCPEDHARLVAIHLLRHGAARPLWLLDLAVLIERRPPGFDWSRLLTPRRRLTSWVATAILLARSLLGLDLRATPLAEAPAPPAWIADEVLSRWSRASGFGEFVEPLALVAGIRRVVRNWRERVPSPIQASLRFGLPPGGWARWPLQLAEFVIRLKDEPGLVALHLERRRRLRTRRTHTTRDRRADPVC